MDSTTSLSVASIARASDGGYALLGNRSATNSSDMCVIRTDSWGAQYGLSILTQTPQKLLKIFDVMGRLIQAQQTVNDAVSINVSAFAKGIYVRV